MGEASTLQSEEDEAKLARISVTLSGSNGGRVDREVPRPGAGEPDGITPAKPVQNDTCKFPCMPLKLC
jgi:hypothetical protein